MRFRSVSAFVALATLATLLLAVAASGAPGGKAGVYIVQLAAEPAVTFTGGADFAATKPAKGEKIDPEASHVKRYVGQLKDQHDAVLARVGGGEKLYDYSYVINGFAAKLTDAQASALAKMSDVVSVEEAEEWFPDTATTPDFLGLTGPNGLWAQLGGPGGGKNAANAAGAGEDIVVGIIDTGIWPEHPSVSDRVDGKLVYKPLPGNRWSGKCASSGDVKDGSWDANLCNQKLVGAQFFLETREAVLGPVTAPDFRSPRDFDGHGTHTGTTAAGNFGVQPTGSLSGFGTVSGMAPRARIAAYKVCWPSCFSPDSAAAYDQAVADGVDVINFSISGSRTAVTGFVPDATRRATEAGVFVAMSAGNSGPGDSTVAHVMPWVTTVAAGTHSRPANGVVTLGNGASYTGASLIKSTLGPKPLVDSVVAGKTGANPTEVQLCYPGTLDSAVVTGKIVLCLRGVIARTDKSRAVKEAGGVGMVLYNDPDSSLNADPHFVPTVHVDKASGLAIKSYAATAGATATLAPGSTAPTPAPFVAAFSSRGPQVGAGNLLKPDVIAPGVDILAGYSPASFELFNIISGTSMSSPHVAGLAALLKHKHASWTPMMIKSALMTTGYDVLGNFSDNSSASSESRRAFAQGAGHVRPTVAADPGLVFTHGADEWRRYVCGVGQSACTDPLSPSELNGASVSIGAMPGARTVTRTVTSVSTASQTYTASFSGLPGITASIDKGMFTVAPGASQELKLTFTNASAPLNKWQAGHLTLTAASGAHTVRIPIVIRPVAISAPTSVTLGADNNASWTIQSGIAGTIGVSKTGLLAATRDTPRTIANEAQVDKAISVPAGTLVQYELFDEDTDGNDDLDLYLLRGSTVLASSEGATSRETVRFRATSAENLTVRVVAYATDGPDAVFTLSGWHLNSAGAGTVTPPSIATTPGQVDTITLTGGSLAAGTRYLGEVAYSQGSSVLARTLVLGKTG